MTMFHVIHDRRGATAFEFTLVLFPLFMIIFAIFDAVALCTDLVLSE